MDTFIQKFLKFLESEKNASPHTVKNYFVDLREFALGISGKKITEVDYVDIRGFLAHLKEKNYSKSSISRKLACIRSFFKYMAREGLIQTNPAAGIATPKREKKLPSFLEPEEVVRMLESPLKESWEGKRDRAIMETLYSSGL